MADIDWARPPSSHNSAQPGQRQCAPRPPCTTVPPPSRRAVSARASESLASDAVGAAPIARPAARRKYRRSFDYIQTTALK